jgi:hypothetical protein
MCSALSCPRINCGAAAMESAHTLQRSDQKRVNEVRRVRNALAAGESPLTKLERGVIIDFAKQLGVDEESKTSAILT